MIFWEFHTWKYQKFQNCQNTELLKWSRRQLLTFWNQLTWFHVNSEWQKIPEFHICGKMNSVLSPKKISSDRLFSIFFSKDVTFTKFLSKRVWELRGFLVFPHCNCHSIHYQQKFREINFSARTTCAVFWIDEIIHIFLFSWLEHCNTHTSNALQCNKKVTYKTNIRFHEIFVQN